MVYFSETTQISVCEFVWKLKSHEYLGKVYQNSLPQRHSSSGEDSQSLNGVDSLLSPNAILRWSLDFVQLMLKLWAYTTNAK
jgi:hypothetical protein